MSVSQDDHANPRFSGLQHIEVSLIDRNPENPRMVFPEDELEQLAESIAGQGILVPIVVYPAADRYILIDGERRFRCAETLGLTQIPAVVTTPKTRRENLVQMFNIHLVRAAWQDMPTAWALEKLIEELRTASETYPTDAMLTDITGLSRERISRLRHALTLPKEYQQYIYDGSIPLNFFWELKRNVIDPLASQRPKLWEEFGEEVGVTAAIVKKRLEGVITDTVSLRNVRPIIGYAAQDASASGQDESVLDSTIRSLVKDPEVTIEVAYEDSVQIMVEADKLERRTQNMLISFRRLLSQARNPTEENRLMEIGRTFVGALTTLLRGRA
jgi:ParB family transcriptional regulator, chromosome partitioning protein